MLKSHACQITFLFTNLNETKKIRKERIQCHTFQSCLKQLLPLLSLEYVEHKLTTRLFHLQSQ